MTDKEAMKLALDALQFALHVGFDESSESQMKKGDKAGQQHRQAIIAIKKALAEHAMRETQRLGQEIEQEPPQRTWIGLEGAEFRWFCYTDFLNARKYTKKQRQHICCQLLSEAQSWDIGEYQLMMHDSTKRPQRTEQNFCPRCGKRTPDLITIHTCTPPQEGT